MKILGVALSAAILFVGVAPARAATLSLSPTSGATGASVSASGSGMPKRASGTITFGTTQVATFTTRPNGQYSASFSVPSGYSGATTVRATAGSSSATASFNVTATGPPPPPAPGTWSLKFADEFGSVDTNRWVHRYWWDGDTFWPTGELQVYRPASATANGVLTLQAKPESGLTNFTGSTVNSHGETFCCSSGLMSSGGIKNVTPAGYTFTYGYAEARMWVPQGAGTWPAFWMLNADYSDTAEIDIAEEWGRSPNTVEFHSFGGAPSGGSYTAPTPFYQGWHIFGLDWEPGLLVWYVDGVERFRTTNTNVTSAAHYLMLQLAIGGSTSYQGAPDANTPWPANLLVDWVRVWQK